MITPENINEHNESLFQEQRSTFDSNKLIDLGNGFYGLGLVCLKVVRPKSGDPFILLHGISFNKFRDLLISYNLYKFYLYGAMMFVQKKGAVLRELTVNEIKDLIYPDLENFQTLQVNIHGVEGEFTPEAQREKLLKGYNSVFNKNFFELLPVLETEMYKDDSETAYLHFENGTIKITKEKSELISFDVARDKCVWESQIIPRPISDNAKTKSMFEAFMENVTNKDEKRLLALRTGAGYLLHHYHKQSGGQMVVLYDEQITDIENPQGGTGKGLFVNGLKQMRKTVKIDGKKFGGKDKFDFQEVNSDTQILWIDDASKKLDIDRFNSITTDGFNVERKYKDSMIIPAEYAPKIVIASNIILDCTGSTRIRRQFIVELAPYYSSKITVGNEEPIVAEHGCRFFSEQWTDEEWNTFYWYMIGSIQLYLKEGLKNVSAINRIENRGKQILGEEFFYWAQDQSFEAGEIYETKALFTDYKEAFDANNESFKQRTFSNLLKKYFALYNQSVEFRSVDDKGAKVANFVIKN